MDLRLHDPDRSAEIMRGLDGFLDGEGRDAAGDRNAEFAQYRLGLILVDVHATPEGPAGSPTAAMDQLLAEIRRDLLADGDERLHRGDRLVEHFALGRIELDLDHALDRLRAYAERSRRAAPARSSPS